MIHFLNYNKIYLEIFISYTVSELYTCTLRYFLANRITDYMSERGTIEIPSNELHC